MCLLTAGDRIKYYRKLLGISQSRLARGSFSKTYIQLVESNKRGLNPVTASIIIDKLNGVAREKGISLTISLDELYMPLDKYVEILCFRRLKECEGKQDYAGACLDILKTAQKYSLSSVIIKIYDGLSFYYYNNGDFNLAIKYSKNKLLICQELKLNNEIAGTFNRIGVFYYTQKNYDEAISYYRQGYVCIIENELKDSIIYAKLLYNIALAYTKIKKFYEAIRYLEVLDKIHDIPESYRTYGLILKANLLMELEDYENALEIFESLIYDHAENIYIIQNNMGLIFSRIGKLDDSIKFYTESINNQLKEPTADMTISLINIARVYTLEGNEKIALIFIEYAIKNSICFNQVEHILTCLELLKTLYSKPSQKGKLCDYLDNIISLYEQKLNDLEVLGTFKNLKQIFA